MHPKGTQTGDREGTPAQKWPSEIKPISLPVLVGFVVATIAFGAARIHASGSIASIDRPAVTHAVTTRLVDFKPNSLPPAAFAD